ncbi:hypothetical protein CsatA_027836 [Cannabis sativa]
MEKRTTSTVITIHDDTDSSSQELGVCGKLLTMIRRISSRQASPVMTPRGSSRSSHRNHSAVKFIDIVSGGSSPTTKATTTNTVLVHNKRKHSNNKGNKDGDDDVKKIPEEKITTNFHDHLNHEFDKFLNRTKNSFKAPEVDNKVASAGENHHHHHHQQQQQHHGIKKKESFKDHISDYIHRTKFMIRSHPPGSTTMSHSKQSTNNKN